MTECFIYDTVRTPRGKGKKDGKLHEITSLDLSRQMLTALRDRNGLDTSVVDDVIWGCVEPVAEQGADIARTAVLAAEYAQSVAGVQINRFCASGLEAVNIAAARVMSGMADMAIGGGVESMSRIPMGTSGGAWPMDPAIAIPAYFVPQGISADIIATKYGFTREQCDAYAVESQRRAGVSWSEGRFAKSVVAVKDVADMMVLDRDEHMRPTTTVESLSGLNPSFAMPGQMGFDAVAIQRYPELEAIRHVHHAGNSSGVVDGAAAVLVGTREAGAAQGMKPRARIKGFAAIGSEPCIMLTGPEFVTQKLLKRLGMGVGDIDIWELNEAFASVVLRYQQAIGMDSATLNPCGGAIAMGHPLGATGAMILGIALDELERTGKSTALVTLCIGAGMGCATVIERV